MPSSCVTLEDLVCSTLPEQTSTVSTYAKGCARLLPLPLCYCNPSLSQETFWILVELCVVGILLQTGPHYGLLGYLRKLDEPASVPVTLVTGPTIQCKWK